MKNCVLEFKFIFYFSVYHWPVDDCSNKICFIRLWSRFLRLTPAKPKQEPKANFGQAAHPNPEGHGQHKSFPKSGRTKSSQIVITGLWCGQPPDFFLNFLLIVPQQIWLQFGCSVTIYLCKGYEVYLSNSIATHCHFSLNWS
jgi:hypothetical protein